MSRVPDEAMSRVPDVALQICIWLSGSKIYVITREILVSLLYLIPIPKL